MQIRRFPHKPRMSTVVNMNDSNAMALGGRLPILGVAEMNAEQRKLADKIVQRRSRHGDELGYRTTTDDGALIGPFNAFLRAPEVGDAYLAWAQAVAASSLSRQLTEACILGGMCRPRLLPTSQPRFSSLRHCSISTWSPTTCMTRCAHSSANRKRLHSSA